MSFLLRWQDTLIFHPVAPNKLTYPMYADHEFVMASGGYRLQGWRFTNDASTADKTILYFGGNAEDITLNFHSLGWLGARHFIFVNYRGYGGSEGSPSQKAFYKDALNIYDYLAQDPQFSADKLIVVGRSLGSSVATYLSKQRAVAKVVLITPFDRLATIAKKLFPFLPVRDWLLLHPFPSAEYAESIKSPMLMLVAANDEMIPTESSRHLYQSWLGEKHWQLLDGVGHNDIQMHADYYELIRDFVEE